MIKKINTFSYDSVLLIYTSEKKSSTFTSTFSLTTSPKTLTILYQLNLSKKNNYLTEKMSENSIFNKLLEY